MRVIYIDPAYKAYYQDRLFDENDKFLNRDDTLAPIIRVKSALQKIDVSIRTADFLFSGKNLVGEADYYSFGVIENYQNLSKHLNIKMRAFVIFEPPVVAPHLYRELPQLTKVFERVYIHNVDGDGYSLKGVDTSKLSKFYWPQPRNEVIESIWSLRNRQRKIVVINGNHKPVSFNRELYSKRIEAITSLARLGAVDLYGRGWGRWWSRNSMWMPYFSNRKSLISVYKGACESKYSVLGDYEFALCFENMAMKGYITEKIFDCFYAGTIPLYWGATDITDLIPREAYIDVRNFATWEEMYQQLMSMSGKDIEAMKDAGRAFLRSELGLKFYDGLLPVFTSKVC
jgi:alpha(1,3/1,4) fucosyltransferase